MATSVDKKAINLVVIVGPTASGKSDLAMRVAQEYNGEIICADSRTIYKYMDIGTAKPSAEDQAKVPHWGLDIAEPGRVFTAADFQSYANKTIADVQSRGRLPVLVGGSGLYIDGVILDYQFGAPQPEKRQQFESLSIEELKAYCYKNNVELPKNTENRRYIVRAIEQKKINDKRLVQPQEGTLVVGLTTDNEHLRSKIGERIEYMFDLGVVNEAKMLGEKYSWDSEAMTGNIYRLIRQFLDGEFDEAELKRRCIVADWRLAKRQKTWFKRHNFIQWKIADEAFEFISAHLSANESAE